MSDLPVGAELDAAVLKALGWTYEPERIGEMITRKAYWLSPDSREAIYIDDELRCNLSTSDPKAVRLCLPWLRERSPVVVMTMMPEGAYVTIEVASMSNLRVQRDGDTLAHALCLAVLAVSEKEQADA